MSYRFDLNVTGINSQQANDLTEYFMKWVTFSGGEIKPGFSEIKTIPPEGLRIEQAVSGLGKELMDIILWGLIQLVENYGGKAGGGFVEVDGERRQVG